MYKKILIDKSGNGIILSQDGIEWMKVNHPESPWAVFYSPPKNIRDNIGLIELYNSLGKKAFQTYCRPELIEIPSEVDYKVVTINNSEVIADSKHLWY